MRVRVAFLLLQLDACGLCGSHCTDKAAMIFLDSINVKYVFINLFINLLKVELAAPQLYIVYIYAIVVFVASQRCDAHALFYEMKSLHAAAAQKHLWILYVRNLTNSRTD